MKVKTLRKALRGVPDSMKVEMADGLPVTLAEVVDGVFVISDPQDDGEEETA